jgi:polysaccharide pyruvyl transferase WcaK-like protein
MISTIGTLREFMPYADFVTFVQFSDFPKQYNVKVIQNKIFSKKFFSFYQSLKSSFDLFLCFLWMILHRHLGLNANLLISGKKLREYAKADIIIDVSMDLYSDDFGAISVIEHSKDILLGILLMKRVVIYAQSMGPFRNRMTLPLVRFTLNRVSLITIREEITRDYLQEIGIEKPPIYLTADPSFLLEPVRREVVEEIFLREGIDKRDKPLIGMTVSPANSIAMSIKESRYLKIMMATYRMLEYFLPEKLFEVMVKMTKRAGYYSKIRSRYFRNMEPIRRAVDYLTGELGATVVFIPHGYSPGEGDDRIMAEEIYRTVKHKHKVKLITGDYTSQELKGIIGECDLFIGVRMHANIAATSSYVPTLAIAYSHKARGIMKMLGQEKYVCEKVTTQDLISKIDEIWFNKEKITKELKRRIKTLKKNALLNGKLVKEL